MKFRAARTAAIIATAVVIPLSIVQWRSGYASASLFYALFPGNVVHLLITGGHGGTKIEDAIAPYMAALTNIAAYSILIFACARFGKAVKRAANKESP
jgi:hypothetical protein